MIVIVTLIIIIIAVDIDAFTTVKNGRIENTYETKQLLQAGGASSWASKAGGVRGDLAEGAMGNAKLQSS